MSRAKSWVVRGAIAAIVGAASAAPGHAQEERQFETLFGPLELIVGGHVGFSHFSEFLEQRVAGEGERELRAQDAPTLGGTLAVSRWPLTEIRLEFDWTRTDIEFEDDSVRLWTLASGLAVEVLVLSIKTKVHAIGPGVIAGLLKAVDLAVYER